MARDDAAKAPPLTAERILEAARAIARTEGIDALSMRRLAEELDVWPMRVYRYFSDKDELLDAIVGSAAAEVETPNPSLPWRDRLTGLVTGMRAALEPGDLVARLPRAALSPAGLKLADTGIAIMIDAGFTPGEAARAWHLLLSYASSPAPVAEAREARFALAGLPEDDYPALAGAGDAYAAALSDRDEAFAYGLDRLLDGLEQRLRAPAA